MVVVLESIAQTFYEQFFGQSPYAKQLQTQTVSRIVLFKRKSFL